METTNKELHALAKSKGLLYEFSYGIYNAYVHITADDSEGLEGRPPESYNVTIMTAIDDNTEQIAKEAAKVILEKLPKFEKKKPRKSKKSIDRDYEIGDNDQTDSFESETETNAQTKLALSIV